MNDSEVIMEPVMMELIVTSYDGETYEEEGDVISYGCYHGKGKAKFDNGCSYTGQYYLGLFHGKGNFVWADDTSYEGEFKFGQVTGKGKYTWSDDSVYEGEVLNGKRHGKGILKNSIGQMYDGDWKDGLKHGFGKYWFDETGNHIYNGEWDMGRQHGYGSMRYNNGNSYEGYWSDSRKLGLGVMIWRDIGEIYTGEWIDDVPHGKGEYIWGAYETINQRPTWKQHCNIYRGYFHYGERHGHGSFFYADGSQYCGEWHHNKKHGEGIFYHNDGKIFYGLFSNDYIDKINDTLPINKVGYNNIIAVKETNDVCTQYFLNINDIYIRYIIHEKPMENRTSEDMKEYFREETKETERILLRYHSYLKQHHKIICDRSNKHRMKLSSLQCYISYDEMIMASYSKIERVMYNTRQFHPCRLYSATIHSLQLFLLEVGLIDPIICNHADMKMIIYDMKLAKHMETKQKRWSFNRQATSKDIDVKEYHKEYEIHDIIENSGNFDISGIRLSIAEPILDPRYPILEHEFMELIVRCIASYQIKNYSFRITKYSDRYFPLSKIVYKFLAEKIQPVLSNANEIDPFIRAYTSDIVQEYFHSNEIFLKLKYVWNQLLDFTKQLETKYVTIGALIKFMKNMVGNQVFPSDTNTLLRALNINTENNMTFYEDIDPKHIDYDDFVFIITKVMISDTLQQVAVSDEMQSEVLVKELDNISLTSEPSIQNKITSKVGDWLKTVSY